jgi:hypothetical protein
MKVMMGNGGSGGKPCFTSFHGGSGAGAWSAEPATGRCGEILRRAAISRDYGRMQLAVFWRRVR